MFAKEFLLSVSAQLGLVGLASLEGVSFLLRDRMHKLQFGSDVIAPISAGLDAESTIKTHDVSHDLCLCKFVALSVLDLVREWAVHRIEQVYIGLLEFI